MTGLRMIYPVRDGARRITQGFGRSSIDYSRYGLIGHNGIDFGGTVGEAVLAVADGRVARIGVEPKGYGNFVVLDLGGYEALYGHLLRATVRVGQAVRRGEKIGELGFSGFVIPAGAAGAHLHFGLRRDGANRKDGYLGYEDPARYLVSGAAAEERPDCSAAEDGKRKGRLGVQANLRDAEGAAIGMIFPGITVELTGERRVFADGLARAECSVRGWIAERDYDGTAILTEV